MENNTSSSGKNTISAILGALKKNWILILVVLLIFTIAGTIYSKMQNPVYTARQKAFYTAKNIVVENDNSAEHVNAARAYIDTVADFCNEENSVKRADYMYGRYLIEKENDPTLTADKFLANYDEENKKYQDYTELVSLIGQKIDVFFTVSVEENKKPVEKTYNFSGKLMSFEEDKITLENGNASVTVNKGDFLYAKISDTFKSEYERMFLVVDSLVSSEWTSPAATVIANKIFEQRPNHL